MRAIIIEEDRFSEVTTLIFCGDQVAFAIYAQHACRAPLGQQHHVHWAFVSFSMSIETYSAHGSNSVHSD